MHMGFTKNGKSFPGSNFRLKLISRQSPKSLPKKEEMDPNCPTGSGKSAEQRFTEAIAENVESIQIIQPKIDPNLENWTSLLRCLLILCVLILISSLFTRCLPL